MRWRLGGFVDRRLYAAQHDRGSRFAPLAQWRRGSSAVDRLSLIRARTDRWRPDDCKRLGSARSSTRRSGPVLGQGLGVGAIVPGRRADLSLMFGTEITAGIARVPVAAGLLTGFLIVYATGMLVG